MKFLNKPNDNFFYFFAVYSFLFLCFEYIDYLVVLQILTYAGFLVFFCYRLYDYFTFISEHKSRVKKLKIAKGQKALGNLVAEAEENFKEGIIILLITLCFFIALGVLGKGFEKDTDGQTTFAGERFLKKQDLKYDTRANILANTNDKVATTQTPKNTLEVKEETNDGDTINNAPNIDDVGEKNIEEKKNEAPKQSIKPKDIPGNITKETTGSSLSLERNFEVQVKDIYNLEPFTKYGSDFFNILQLQRVLNKLGYYSGVADGAFNFETKLAIYNTLVGECRWPKASTKGVFGPQAKKCIDNLYIVVQDGETNGLVE